MNCKYPTGLAVNALAEPFAPIVVWVTGLASTNCPKIKGDIKTGRDERFSVITSGLLSVEVFIIQG
jgi:hypothetical protein